MLRALDHASPEIRGPPRSRRNRIALDNFVYDHSNHRLVESCDIMKIDVVGHDQREVAEQVRALGSL